jgi:hypothetical protein
MSVFRYFLNCAALPCGIVVIAAIALADNAATLSVDANANRFVDGPHRMALADEQSQRRFAHELGQRHGFAADEYESLPLDMTPGA